MTNMNHNQNSECTCASFFTVRGTHKPDCPCHTTPEADVEEWEKKAAKFAIYLHKRRGKGYASFSSDIYEFAHSLVAQQRKEIVGRMLDVLISEGYLKGREPILPDTSKKEHGICCYCPNCGHDKDECVCEHNDLLQALTDAQAIISDEK